MKLQTAAVIIAGLTTFAALADDLGTMPPAQPPDQHKISYAFGMRLGEQIKPTGVDVDADMVAQAVKDVLEGKPTQIQESEIRPLLRQAQAYQAVKQSEKSRADGAAFLAKNAKAQGVTEMPDGVQYRILTAGAGEMPKTTDVVVLNFQGTWINGDEFRHGEDLHIPFMACPKAWRETLERMKTGSKWQVFAPSSVSYGHPDRRVGGFGSTLIYELELVSIDSGATPSPKLYSGGRLGHALYEDFLPPAEK